MKLIAKLRSSRVADCSFAPCSSFGSQSLPLELFQSRFKLLFLFLASKIHQSRFKLKNLCSETVEPSVPPLRYQAAALPRFAFTCHCEKRMQVLCEVDISDTFATLVGTTKELCIFALFTPFTPFTLNSKQKP